MGLCVSINGHNRIQQQVIKNGKKNIVRRGDGKSCQNRTAKENVI